jgi:fatty acid-binding protein DegV
LPVSILTDSAASLPKDITTAATISVVPMWLTIGDTSMHDGDLSLEEVVARIDEGITTSAPRKRGSTTARSSSRSPAP